jgi:hypothetical protein
MWKSRANNRAPRYHSIVERKRLSAAVLRSCLMRYHMPRRYQPAQLLAAIIIGIFIAVVILILYGHIWL